MDVVVIFNGLGNQMSQYAFYLAKKKIDKKVKCIFDPNSFSEHNGSELDYLFGISYKRSMTEIILTKIYSYRIRPKIWRVLKFFGIKEIKEPSNYDYNKNFLERGPIGINFYWGGWHSEKYYQAIINDLKSIYVFKSTSDKETSSYQEQIENTNSISVHIRRGDYLKHKEYGDVANMNYYLRAVNYVRNHVTSPTFYVFSNDLDWCRKNFKDDDFIFVDCNSEKTAWRDMFLMSLCKHHINANSTFSWWAAWLSPNDGITIVPQKFLLNTTTKDIYPERWIKI